VTRGARRTLAAAAGPLLLLLLLLPRPPAAALLPVLLSRLGSGWGTPLGSPCDSARRGGELRWR
jgi:hypothetical protein